VGNRPFYSTEDPCVMVRVLIENHGGDKEAAIHALFGGSCSYLSARQLSVSFAHCFEMGEIEFMAYYRQWRKR